jgi:hypothetical protein
MRAARTFRCVAVGGAAAVLRSRALRWGATREEIGAALPGDELVRHADLTATRAITVRTTPDDVWPWIAQLGQGRGGFYSYDVLENLVGCDIHSADRIVAEWQSIQVGAEVNLHPEAGLVAALVEPGRALVLRGGAPIGRAPSPYDFTWAFVLRRRADGATRLVVRERYGYVRWWAPSLVEPVELISLIMSRRMLRGIKERAERRSALGIRPGDQLRGSVAHVERGEADPDRAGVRPFHERGSDLAEAPARVMHGQVGHRAQKHVVAEADDEVERAQVLADHDDDAFE